MSGITELVPATEKVPTLDGSGMPSAKPVYLPTSTAASVPSAQKATKAEGIDASWPTKRGERVDFDEETLDRLNRCMDRTGVRFRNLYLLWLALRHASAANNSLDSNERLEFLGDSILGHAASELLFFQYPEKQEGDLTRMKALMVSSKWCNRFCADLGLRDYIQLGKGIQLNGVSEKVLGNLFEAFIGGVAADSGSARAQTLLNGILNKFLAEIEAEADSDNPKSDLQHIAQREFNASPVYEVVEESGPDHQKSFRIQVRIVKQSFPPAIGSSKRTAEKQAARNALNALRERHAPKQPETMDDSTDTPTAE